MLNHPIKGLFILILCFISLSACQDGEDSAAAKKEPVKQAFIEIEGHKIGYYQSLGKGQSILLVHGNSASGLAFSKQLDSPLGDKYHLLSIDLPGHGNSDPFAEVADYSLPNYAHLIAAFAKKLQLKEPIVVGWSLGGHIVLEAMDEFPNAKGFVIFGTPPLAFPPDMEQAFLPNPAMGLGFKPDLTPEQAKLYATSFFAPEATLDKQAFIQNILETDGKARAGVAAGIKPDGYKDEVALLANLSTPIAIFHGEKEQLVNLAYIQALKAPSLWKNQVQVIAKAGHAAQWEAADAFNQLLEDFVKDLEAKDLAVKDLEVKN